VTEPTTRARFPRSTATPSRPGASERTRLIILTLSVLLVASVGVNAYLVQIARGYEKGANSVRLDPGGLRIYASERTKPRGDDPLLVFFGDSRIAMWPAPAFATGYRIVNRGIGYQTTAQMLVRIDADLASLQPNVVVLEAGVNDLKTIADFPARRGEIVADCEAHLARIVQRCHEMGARVVLVTVFAIGDVAPWRAPFWSNDVRVAVREVNAILPSLVGDKDVLFDANAVLVDEHGDVRRPFQVDYLHLSPAGYAALNQALQPALSAILAGQARTR
jgi:lysophospholipase L1-like esterase